MSNIRIRIALISIFGGVIILALKWYSANITGSVALKSDALEGVVNVVAAVFSLGAIIFAEKPADKDHPYGHGKMEYFSAVFEGGLITFAAVLIAYESLVSLMGGVEIRNLERGIYFNLGAGLLNGMLGFWLFKSGTRLKSEALKADGLHILSDFYTTLGVAVGLVIVYWTGIAWLDPVIGFGISIILGITGFNLVRAASGALLDSQDTKMVSQISEAMNELRPNEVITVHELRAIRAGRYTHVDVHIVVPEYLPVREAHDIVDRFCTQVIQRARVEGEFHPHVDPCRKKYCAQCMINDCKIRAHPLQKREVITAESVVEIDPDEFEESRPF